jgi:ParB family transcriptional regulator, chromosome partitioning protein
MTNEIQTVALNKLSVSSLNVRKNTEELDSLKANIKAVGLLQNLQVVKGKKGKYEVVAGARRFTALSELAAAGEIAADYAVAVQIIGKEKALTVSLSENAIRQDMTPAEQFKAFAAMKEQGKAEQEIAATFGVSVTHVKKLLKLANVSPVIFSAFVEGEIDLERMQAYAVTDDHAKQDDVFASLGKYVAAYSIRRALMEEKIESNDNRVKFVGLDTYEARGGKVEADLFQEISYLDDAVLLETLVLEKLEAEAEQFRAEGWKWVETAISFDYSDRAHYGSVYKEHIGLPDDEKQTLDAYEAEYAELEEHMYSDDFTEEQSARSTELESLIRDLNSKARAFSDDDKAKAGVMLHIGYGGQLEVSEGLVRSEDKVKTSKQSNTQTDKPRVSGRLRQDMSVHYTSAMRDKVMNNPALAYDAMLVSLVQSTFQYGLDKPLTINFTTEKLDWHSDSIKNADSYKAYQAAYDAWEAILPTEQEMVWQWVENSDPEQKAQLFAFCVSGKIDCIQYNRPNANPLYKTKPLESRADVDMADYWQPNQENYLSMVRKTQMLEAVAEACGQRQATHMMKLKTPELREQAEKLICKKGWLPPELKRVSEEQTDAAMPLAA